MKNHHIFLAALIPALAFLPGCDLFKGKSATPKAGETPAASAGSDTGATAALSSDVLLAVGGKPKITVAQYEAYVADIMKMQPHPKTSAFYYATCRT